MDKRLVTRFSERAAAVGANVQRVDPARLFTLLAGAPVGTESARRQLPGASWRPADPARTELDRIVAFGRLGVAETGSVLIAEANLDRGLCLLADELIVIVRAGTILPTLTEAIAEAGRLAGAGHHHLNFLSGPSRTGDIERVLVTGVHGPGVLTIVILEDS